MKPPQAPRSPYADAWPGCYNAGWQGLITPEAYSHPAKFARGLIQRIYQHVAAEGWLHPGETCLDVFGGVGLGACDALQAGYRWIGVELEPRFHDMGAGCDCTGISPAVWRQFYGRWQRVSHTQGHHWCPACLATAGQVTGERTPRKRTFHTRPKDGKNRQSKTVLYAPLPFPDRRDGVVPPTRQHAPALFAVPTTAYARNSGVIPGVPTHHYEGNLGRWARQTGGHATLLQGDSRHLASVLAQADVCVSSPPWAECDNYRGESKMEFEARRQAARGRNPEGYGHLGSCNTYGTAPGQLGALPPGSVAAALECVVASPPWTNQLVDHDTPEKYQALKGKVHANGKGHGGSVGASQGQSYGTAPGQLGALPPGSVAAALECVVASPPYANGCTHTGGADTAPEHIQGGPLPYVAYGTSPHQLGNATPDTFWAAARTILAQTYQVLKPGGHAVWVVKAYCRDGQIVDFPGQWRTLCEAVGFVTLHEHHALLVEEHGTQGSFLRQQGPDRKRPTSQPFDPMDYLIDESTYVPESSFTASRTERKSFFRRLHEKKRPDLAINHETVYCMVKPHSAAPMPPDEAWEQLALCDVAVSSPPYASIQAPTCEGNVGGHLSGAIASRMRRPHENVKSTGYGDTSGQLGAMPPGPTPPQE